MNDFLEMQVKGLPQSEFGARVLQKWVVLLWRMVFM